MSGLVTPGDVRKVRDSTRLSGRITSLSIGGALLFGCGRGTRDIGYTDDKM